MDKHQIERVLQRFSTPLYVFDLPVLKERIRHLRQSLPSEVALCYAMKANPFLVGELENDVERFEVCSFGEYLICQEQGIASEKLVISGVHKTRSSIDSMIKAHPEMKFTVESMSQFLMLAQSAIKYRVCIEVLLRLTSGNQFGLDVELLKAIVRNRSSYPNIHIIGIQYFSGTQKHSVKRLQKEINQLRLLLDALRVEYGYQAQEIELGTGFPVYYFQGEQFDEDAFLLVVSELLTPLCQRVSVTVELGRSIAACCGTYLTSVVDIKQTRERIISL